MGEIWLGALVGAEGYRKPVVLKRALAREPAAQARAEQLLVDEALVASGLSHPNVIHVYELVRTEYGLMLAMEHLEGASLRALLRHAVEHETSLPPRVALRIASDLARGLAHAHGAHEGDDSLPGVAHGDVSPENAYVTTEGITKLIDFGAASGAAPREHDATIELPPAPLFGKDAYAAPELRVPGAVPSRAADVFALGTLLAESCAELPASARDLVRRATVRDAAQRTLSAADLADALDGAASDLGGTHREVARYLRAELGEPLARASARVRAALDADALREERGGGEDGASGPVSVVRALDTLTDARVPEARTA